MSSSQGKVFALSISAKKGVAKANVKTVQLVKDWGIKNDAHAGKWHRQVSFLALESIEKIRAKGLKVRPGAFAENITTELVDVPHFRVGQVIKLGQAELEITQIGKECHTRCAIYYRAGDCVMPREGVFARVVKSGEVTVGDAIEVIEPAEAGEIIRPEPHTEMND
jgi:MOSC domain-containing protein YiiM